MNIPISYWSKPLSFYCEAHNEILGRMSKLHFPQWKFKVIYTAKIQKEQKAPYERLLLVIKMSQAQACTAPWYTVPCPRTEMVGQSTMCLYL